MKYAHTLVIADEKYDGPFNYGTDYIMYKHLSSSSARNVPRCGMHEPAPASGAVHQVTASHPASTHHHPGDGGLRAGGRSRQCRPRRLRHTDISGRERPVVAAAGADCGAGPGAVGRDRDRARPCRERSGKGKPGVFSTSVFRAGSAPYTHRDTSVERSALDGLCDSHSASLLLRRRVEGAAQLPQSGLLGLGRVIG